MARNRKRLEELGVLEAVRDLEALPKPEPKPKYARLHVVCTLHSVLRGPFDC